MVMMGELLVLILLRHIDAKLQQMPLSKLSRRQVFLNKVFLAFYYFLWAKLQVAKWRNLVRTFLQGPGFNIPWH